MLGDSGKDGTCLSRYPLQRPVSWVCFAQCEYKGFLARNLKSCAAWFCADMCSSRKQQQVMYLYYRICIRIVFSWRSSDLRNYKLEMNLYQQIKKKRTGFCCFLLIMRICTKSSFWFSLSPHGAAGLVPGRTFQPPCSRPGQPQSTGMVSLGIFWVITVLVGLCRCCARRVLLWSPSWLMFCWANM